LIQLSDAAGAYGVSFVVMLAAAALAETLPPRRPIKAIVSIAAAVAVVTATLGYGWWRLGQDDALRPGPKVALIQGSIDTQVKVDPNLRDVVHRQYMDLSRQAVRENSDLDLIVWPETMFREPLITFASDFQPPADAEWTADDARLAAMRNEHFISQTVRELGTPTILGIDRHCLARGRVDHYNAALYVGRDGRLLGRYEKVHPVMFGEYIPLGDRIPWLYRVTPLAVGLKPGAGPESFQVGPFRACPDICFENILPHLIRSQVNTLRRRGAEPDLLINLTNDGWFWGSSELDLHLMCAVFRAVEMRKPFLVAANTGFSASIDSTGRILAQGPRRQTAVLATTTRIDNRRSPYAHWGDWPAGLCLALCVLTAAARLGTRCSAAVSRRFAILTRQA
jgi:apolipoprotein N-acyltransferase